VWSSNRIRGRDGIIRDLSRILKPTDQLQGLVDEFPAETGP
jgi:hypothetical protein